MPQNLLIMKTYKKVLIAVSVYLAACVFISASISYVIYFIECIKTF